MDIPKHTKPAPHHHFLHNQEHVIGTPFGYIQFVTPRPESKIALWLYLRGVVNHILNRGGTKHHSKEFCDTCKNYYERNDPPEDYVKHNGDALLYIKEYLDMNLLEHDDIVESHAV